MKKTDHLIRSCFVFIGKFEGVREGSIIAAILIGNNIKMYSGIYRKVTGKIDSEAGKKA